MQDKAKISKLKNQNENCKSYIEAKNFVKAILKLKIVKLKSKREDYLRACTSSAPNSRI